MPEKQHLWTTDDNVEDSVYTVSLGCGRPQARAGGGRGCGRGGGHDRAVGVVASGLVAAVRPKHGGDDNLTFSTALA